MIQDYWEGYAEPFNSIRNNKMQHKRIVRKTISSYVLKFYIKQMWYAQ